MSIYGCLVLPPDVRIVPVLDLDAVTRGRIDALEGDYTITRPKSRTPTSVLDADSAELLASFRTPARIVDAVAEFAARRGSDPQATLDAAYPMLSRLYRMQLLVPEASALAVPIEGELKPGDEVLGFRLIRRVQVLDDNEVFLARDARGRHAAVKFYRGADRDAVRRLVREARLLRRIGGSRVPAVFALSRGDSGVGLVTEWVSGLEAHHAAALFQGVGSIREESGLLSLCVEIASAFAEIHESGVVHGDVHPRNVLIEASGAARLIDFGLARDFRRLRHDELRRGVTFYLAPEHAQAARRAEQVLPSKAGEQYALAALLYELWTGAPYLNWSLERDETLRQIVEDRPLALEARHVPAWPALEEVLRRALAKRAEERFPSVRALADALGTLLPEAVERDRGRRESGSGAAPERVLLGESVRRYGLGGPALADGLPDAPFASINYGAAGIAYALLRMAQRRGDPRLLAAADLWSQCAYAQAQREGAFFNADLQIERATVGEISLFHSLSGLHCVRALASAAQGDVASANAALKAFVAHTTRPFGGAEPAGALDLALGASGLLLGCAELVESIPDLPVFFRAPVLERGEQIAQEILGQVRTAPIAESDLRTLGVAHGWSGLLFSLLRWTCAVKRHPDPVLRDRLEELAALAQPIAGGLRWPVLHGGDSFMDGWCNGSAGHAMLFALACRIFGRPEFGILAERAATSACSSLSRLGSLCCGQAGIGYALLAVHRLTGDPVWLRRARSAARRAAGDRSKHFVRDALYKGGVGVALLAEDLDAPEEGAMPLFESAAC